VVDHLLLVPMYESHSKALPARVAKHKSKLRAFDFNVVYKAGITTPSDYGSRHPPPSKQYVAAKREDLGVESEEEEDAEVVIARLETISDAMTLTILAQYTYKEYKQLLEDVKQGQMSVATTELTGINECFTELSVNQGILLRGKRLLIPTKLRPVVLEAAHKGCPGGDSMLQQLRMDVWGLGWIKM
jgi:hypothetical protein